MTSSPLSTHSFENDSPSPCSSLANVGSSISSGSQSSKDQHERMEIASCTSADSGVDGIDDNSHVGSSSEFLSTNRLQNDISAVLSKNIDDSRKCTKNEKSQDMIVEDTIPSNITMTL